MTAVEIFCILCLLLVCGKVLRIFIPFLQRLYLPSSVIGGLLGLVIFSCFGQYLPAEWTAGMKKLPGFLINVIFAALFLGAITPKFKEVFSIALPQLCIGQILAWGQYVVGLGLAGFLLAPLFNLPPAFGNLLEIGFEGGHGTVGGMAESFKSFNWEDGVALGYTVATVGMIIGIVIGMAMVNWALRKNIVSSVRTFEEREHHEQIGIYHHERQPHAGLQTVQCDSIDSLAFHVALIGMAVLIGFCMLQGLRALEIALFPDATTRIFNGFPLFPLCMIGGVLIQIIAQKTKTATLIDRGQMQRLSGAALDFLVVAAVATIQISVVLNNWLPLLILILAGIFWSVFCVMFLAPRILKEAWFERAIAEFGQSTGVTATGLMLLRTVDPENKTVAAASFGYKQLFHEPIMGGGIWTALALTLVFTVGWLPIWGFCVVLLLIWLGIGLLLARKKS